MIRFKHYIAEGGKLQDDKIKQAADMLSNPGYDDEDIIKAVGKAYLKAAKKAKGIKEAEGDEEKMGQTLGTGEVKAINAKLFSAVKDTKGGSDLKALFDPIRDIMSEQGIEIAIGNRLITSKGQKEFSCAPYTNVKLVVSWSESKGEYLLKDASLQGVKE
jgi:hypothetical protein